MDTSSDKRKEKNGARLIPYLGALEALYYHQKSKLEKKINK